MLGTGRLGLTVVFGAHQLCGICSITFLSGCTPGVFTLSMNSGACGEEPELEGFFFSCLSALVFKDWSEVCSEALKVVFSGLALELVE